MFCNGCGTAVIENASTCTKCGAGLPQLASVEANYSGSTTRQRTARRWRLAVTLLLGAIGIMWDVLAAWILFRSYSFFESVVVCLLVMILCATAAVRADVELSGIFQRSGSAKESEVSEPGESELLDQLRAHLRGLFYGIAFLMALVKLVLALIG